MLYEDLSALYAQFVDSDDIPVDEVVSAINTYSEENDLLFTVVLEELREKCVANMVRTYKPDEDGIHHFM